MTVRRDTGAVVVHRHPHIIVVLAQAQFHPTGGPFAAVVQQIAELLQHAIAFQRLRRQPITVGAKRQGPIMGTPESLQPPVVVRPRGVRFIPYDSPLNSS